ncbi:DNA repair protein complementing XP-C cells-like [Mya arenaria]|uniref:DNA repair protein complementing XP-C cells-like n=1 Tax=Mya arenaria TaxID=6604 RepID=UPI0022E8A157|nr:DNA repair protein complementing XP-C cells-like [Mya arenaria]XP_052779236.1 DNA repair protein complementing XP-C cells-like [Mya arenaria]
MPRRRAVKKEEDNSDRSVVPDLSAFAKSSKTRKCKTKKVSEYFSADSDTDNHLGNNTSEIPKLDGPYEKRGTIASKVKKLNQNNLVETGKNEVNEQISGDNNNRSRGRKRKSDDVQVKKTSQVNDANCANTKEGVVKSGQLKESKRKKKNAAKKLTVVEETDKHLENKTTRRKKRTADVDDLEITKPKRTRGKSSVKDGIAVVGNKRSERNKPKETIVKIARKNIPVEVESDDESDDDFMDVTDSKDMNKDESDDDFDEVDSLPDHVGGFTAKTELNFDAPLPKSVDHSDAMAVLLHMEGEIMPSSNQPIPAIPSTSKSHARSVKGQTRPKKDRKVSGKSPDVDEDVEEMEDSSEESEEEWEDVKDHHTSPKKSQLPNGPVEIILEAPVLHKKKKKKGFDLETYFRRQINKFKKELAIDIHKVHLMCLLARCQYLNSLCQEETIRAQAFSIVMVTKELQLPAPAKCNENQIARAVVWMKSNKKYLTEVFGESFQPETSHLNTVLICVVLLRQIGLLTRLVTSLQPLPLKECSAKGKAAKSGKRNSTDGKRSTKEKLEVRKETKKKKGKKKKVESDSSPELSDSDFEEDSLPEKSKKLRRQTSGSKNRSLLPTNDVDGNTACDHWVEVFVAKEQKWLSIDGESLQVKKPYELENRVTPPLAYVIGISQDGHIKDVTARYASQWLTETRKLRVDRDWWGETLAPYSSQDKQADEQEDQQMAASLQQQPMPTSVGAFKSHPLYVLRRHLLKFEAIYPDSAIPVGYIRGEPVYARECVHVLHSRENWLKEGRAVRLAEEPYKFVKSRPKWNKPKNDPEAKDLEIFGKWQTEVYIPPPAVDGKVPRNAHGNVEMFLPSMLPAGTVHLKPFPALNRIARKLDIDCAPAMIGWDNHCGFSHPLMDGWIVCEEHKDILIAAWDEEQEIIREREQQKREKRVYENWRKLIRGLQIRERLKNKYDWEEESKPEDNKAVENKATDGLSVENDENAGKSDSQSQNTITPEKVSDVCNSWPQNRLTNAGKTVLAGK